MPILNMVGGGKKGGNIGEPLNLAVTTSGLDATIKWEDNEIGTIPPTTFQKSELVRKIGSAPTSPSDGDLVVTETVKDTYKTTGYVDQGLTDGETYYYRVFSYSDLGGISYCDAVSVTPSAGGWQPGANTVLYMPFKEDLLDHGQNNISFTTDGTSPTIVDGTAYFNGGGLYTSPITNTYMSNHIFTVSVWTKWVGNYTSLCGDDSYIGGAFKGWNLGPVNDYWRLEMLPAGGELKSSITASSTQNTWLYITAVFDGTNVTFYFNSVQNNSKAIRFTDGEYGFGVGFSPFRPSDLGGTKYQGYISNLIIENKARTAQEIQDYFNQTKGDYGIS